jgi:hypothetical protein
MFRKLLAISSLLAFLFSTIGTPLVVTAAQLASLKDTMSTQAISTTATHTIVAGLNTGKAFTAGDTMTIDFVDADFTLNAIGNWQTSDFTFNDGTNRTITAVSSTSGVAPTCTSGSNNVAVTINTSTNNFVVTACTSYTSSSTGATITFTINGTTASGTGTMTNKNADLDNSQFSATFAGSHTDSASGALVVETNDIVNITATVTPTLTFANDDATVGFGTLATGSAKYANGAATGSASDTTAHTLTIGTNASSGYTLTYKGSTLTAGSSTITALTAGITDDADGTPGTSQFGLSVAVTGAGTATAGYDNSGTADWKFVGDGNPQTIASATGALSSNSSVAVHYLANIAASTPAGSYATDLTYVATGNY